MKHKSTIFNLSLCCLFYFLILCNTSAQEKYQVRMAMVGNSITYGSGLPNPSQDCYPTKLTEMLETVYGDTVLIKNYGVSGRTMLKNSGNTIWNEIQFRNALEFVPDVCLVMLGTNDSRSDYWDPYGDEFLADYTSMIDTFRFRNPNTKFILCYPPPAYEENTYGMNNNIIEENIIPIIDSMINYSEGTLVDFHYSLWDSTHLFPDYIHPNQEGAIVFAEMLFDTITSKNLIGQVETGYAYVSRFKQYPAIIPVGDEVDLQWETIFADSVFLDGVYMDDVNGETSVIAEQDKVYTLTAKGPDNEASYPLTLWTYIVDNTDESEMTLGISVYPNPAKNTLYVNTSSLNNTELKVEIVNTLGQIILAQEFNQISDNLSIDISTLQTGNYYYKISSDEGSATGQFMKN